MDQEIAQANIDAAHDLEERFHRTWAQLWEDIGLFSNKGFAREFSEALQTERPFLCVRCGKPLSYEELIYGMVGSDKDRLCAVLCYPCKERERAKQAISDFAHGMKGVA